MHNPKLNKTTKYLLVPALLVTGFVAGHFSSNYPPAVAGSGNITEAQFQAGRVCEAIKNSIGVAFKAVGVNSGNLGIQGGADSQQPETYICRVIRDGKTIVRIENAPDGRWTEPFTPTK